MSQLVNFQWDNYTSCSKKLEYKDKTIFQISHTFDVANFFIAQMLKNEKHNKNHIF